MIKEAIGKLVAGQSLTEAEAQQVMTEIMEGAATQAQLGGFLVALRLKGETQEELLGFVRTMRAKAIPVKAGDDLVDTCGTGGDGTGTFNISTAAALVTAAAGLKVAKHGNRSASSSVGAADVLEALGARLATTPAQAQEALNKVGFAFLFAQSYHPAMKNVGGARTEIGVRTVFNVLGPLANPAGASRQLLGVADPSVAPKMAYILQQLGTKHALIVHGRDGMDEISLDGITDIWEVHQGIIDKMSITPPVFGLPPASLKELAGGDKAENAQIIRDIFSGALGPKRNAVLVNAAAAMYVGGKVPDLREGIKLAAHAIDTGVARATLNNYVKVTQGFAS